MFASVHITGAIALALFVVGFFGLLVLVTAAVFRGVAALVRHVFAPTPSYGTAIASALKETCPHARCGHANQANARFCARCGRALRRAFEDAAA